MFRKLRPILALAGLLAAAACNSVSGPLDLGAVAPAGAPPTPSEDCEISDDTALAEKWCLDDERAAHLLNPHAELAAVRGGEKILLHWEVLNFCNGYTATVLVHFEGSPEVRWVGSARNATSLLWEVPAGFERVNACGDVYLAYTLEVIVADPRSMVSAVWGQSSLMRDCTPERRDIHHID